MDSDNDRTTRHRARVMGLVLLAAGMCAGSLWGQGTNAAPAPASGDVVTLAQCVDQAARSGPDVRAAQAAFAAAQASYATALASSSVGLNGSASAGHSAPSLSTTASDSITAGLSLTAPRSTNVGLSASQSIMETATLQQKTSIEASVSSTLWDGYAGGKDSAALAQAVNSLQSATASHAAAVKSVAYNVEKAYYTLLAQQRKSALLAKTVAMRSEELRKSQALYDAQDASLIDLRTAQINLKTAQLDLASADSALAVVRELLSALAGWPADLVYAVEETTLSVPADLDLAALVATALAQRSDMVSLRFTAASSEIGLALARAGASGTVSVNGGAGLSTDWTAAPDISWNISVRVTLPLYDAGSAAAATARAEQARESLKIQEQQLTAAITSTVHVAIAAVQETSARVQISQDALDLAHSRNELIELQFASGVSSQFDVLSASVDLSTAETALAGARSDAELAVLSLYDAIGN